MYCVTAKCVYPCEYLDDETSLPINEDFLQSPKHRGYYWCRLQTHTKKDFVESLK